MQFQLFLENIPSKLLSKAKVIYFSRSNAIFKVCLLVWSTNNIPSFIYMYIYIYLNFPVEFKSPVDRNYGVAWYAIRTCIMKSKERLWEREGREGSREREREGESKSEGRGGEGGGGRGGGGGATMSITLQLGSNVARLGNMELIL